MKRRSHFVKLVTVLCAAIFILGCTTTVFAATDLVGRGTRGSSSNTVTTTTSSSSSRTSASRTTGNTATNAATTYPVTKGNTVKTSVVSTAVQTGVMEHIYPFMIGIGAAFAIFAVFFHLQMNQVRYGKSEKYYKELLDFICACKL